MTIFTVCTFFIYYGLLSLINSQNVSLLGVLVPWGQEDSLIGIAKVRNCRKTHLTVAFKWHSVLILFYT